MSTPFQFEGYGRADGRVGIRNHLLVLSTLALVNRLAELSADGIAEALVVTADFSRGLRGRDAEVQERVIRALIAHPNVGAAVVFVHDADARDRMAQYLRDTGKPAEVVAFMDGRGVAESISRGRAAIERVRRPLREARRVAAGLGELTVALECGGSDPTSAVCANPAIGSFVDRVVAAGGRAIVSETAEFIGAEAVVQRRAASEPVARAILAAIARCERMMTDDGEDYRGVNPTPENLAAGLTTLVEKSMGAIAKCGAARFEGCLDFAQPPERAGLHFMDTPFFSPVSITGMVCAGAQLTLFGLGVFNPSGNPIAPTIKVCGNPHTIACWPDAFDADVSMLVAGRSRLSQAGEILAATVQRVCQGEMTRTERWGDGQVIAPRSLAAL